MNNSGVEKTSTRHMIREGEFIEWKHVVAVKDAPRNIGWSMSRIPNDAVYLNTITKMRITLMEKVVKIINQMGKTRHGFSAINSTT